MCDQRTFMSSRYVSSRARDRAAKTPANPVDTAPGPSGCSLEGREEGYVDWSAMDLWYEAQREAEDS